MGFLNKLFSKKDRADDKSGNDFDNNRLIRLLDKWGREESEHSFKAVLHELFEGDSSFLLPTINEEDNPVGKWITVEYEESEAKFTSVTEQDGVRVLVVFSDETAMFDWAKKVTRYTVMKCRDVFDICRELEIDRIVINSEQKNMFVLERRKEDAEAGGEADEDGTRIRVGIPQTPLSNAILSNINENVRNIPFIEEVYQYIQEDVNEQGASEFVLMIGVKMSDDSEDSRNAMLSAIKQGLTGQKKPELPLGIMVMNEKWSQAMESIGNRPFYVQNPE